jgi:hypothetical protein
MDLTPLDIARFWSRVEVRERDQCWPWRYGLDECGYGEYRALDKSRDHSHRVAYRIGVGEIPEGVVIRHSCDNGACCNWTHLLPGTHADNVQDRVERYRSARGEANGRAKLVSPEVLHIRSSHLSASALAKHYGVSEDTIQDIRTRETWTHLP